MTLQDLILTLSRFWSERGCLLQQPLDIEVGAGTMHPETFLRVIGPRHWNVAYVQPSRRPADGRFGENPNRLFKHHQFQVILKPSPDAAQRLYLDSLEACGIDPSAPRRPLRGGQLGVAHAGGVGHRVAGAARRARDHAVHLLPAGRRHGPGADLGGADLRARAHRDAPAGGGQRVRPRLGARRLLRRGAASRGGRAVEVRLRAGRPAGRRVRADAPRPVRPLLRAWRAAAGVRD